MKTQSCVSRPSRYFQVRVINMGSRIKMYKQLTGVRWVYGWPFTNYDCNWARLRNWSSCGLNWRRIEKFGISSDSCSEDRQFKSVSCNYYPLLRGNLERKVCIVIKTITKEGIQSLIDKKILKPYSGGYMNSRGYHVGYYKTCGNKRYIEDLYADKAEKSK